MHSAVPYRSGALGAAAEVDRDASEPRLILPQAFNIPSYKHVMTAGITNASLV